MIPGFFPITKGGAEIFALNLCKNLVVKGHYVQILTRNLNLPREENMKGIQIRRFSNILPNKIKYFGFGRFLRSKYIRILVAMFDLFGIIPSLWKLHRKNKYQVLHASFILPFGLVGILLKKILKLPLIITVHGPADFYEVPRIFYPLLRFVLKSADRVVAVSAKLMKDLMKRLGRLPLKLIMNGIPLNSYISTKRQDIIKKYKIFSRDFVIIAAGRLVRRKNFDLLIRAVPGLLDKIFNCKIILLGSGVERNNLKKLIQELNLSSIVILPGWISEEEKVNLFKRADIFIQLSQIEGLSLALLESKAAGIPAIIIGTGNFDPVSNEKTGLLIFPPVIPEKVTRAIEFLYHNTELRLQISKNVQDEARKYYSLDKMVEQYLNLYYEVALTKVSSSV